MPFQVIVLYANKYFPVYGVMNAQKTLYIQKTKTNLKYEFSIKKVKQPKVKKKVKMSLKMRVFKVLHQDILFL